MVYQPGAAPQVCNTPTKALCRSKGYILLFQSAKFFFILTYGATIGWKSISPSGKNLYFIRARRTKYISSLQILIINTLPIPFRRNTLQSVRDFKSKTIRGLKALWFISLGQRPRYATHQQKRSVGARGISCSFRALNSFSFLPMALP